MSATLQAALEELRRRDQWVCWRIVVRKGKPTKVPYQPNGREASSTDPSTWSSYAEVAAVVHRFDGPGFVFAEDDEYTGVDIDRALTNGSLHDAVIEIIETLNSYTEWSPSGQGVKAIVRARKPDGSRCSTKQTPWGDEIAIYDQGRYFAITGNALPKSPATIEHRQGEIEALLAKFMPSTNGAAADGAQGARKRRRIKVDKTAVERALAEHPGLQTLVERSGIDASADDYALACAAGRDGLEPDLIEQLVAHRLYRHGDPKGKAHRDDYIPRTVERALAEVAREQRDEELGDPLTDASEIIGMAETPIVCAVERRDGVVVLDRADGLVLKAGSLESLAKYDRLRAAVGAAFGHELKAAKGEGVSMAVQFVSALRRHFGPASVARAAEERVAVWMIELARAASEVAFTAGEAKASAWQEIDDTSPDDAKTAPGFAEKVVLAYDKTTGDRYLRASWVQEYLRRCGLRGSGEEVAALLEALGLEQPNADGRVRGGTIQFRFWVIPAALFGRWKA